jgi:hypothetical protein
MELAKQVLADVTYCRGHTIAWKGADAAVIVTNGSSFGPSTSAASASDGLSVIVDFAESL